MTDLAQAGLRVARPGQLEGVAALLRVPSRAVGIVATAPAWRVLSDGAQAAALLRLDPDLVTGRLCAHVVRAAGDEEAVRAAAATQAADAGAEATSWPGEAPVPLPGPLAEPSCDLPLDRRFLLLAARAASRAAAVVGLLAGTDAGHAKADGSLSLAGDATADAVAAEVLAPLGVALLSEERTDTPDRPAGDEPWIVVDPIDGTGNSRAGLPPWAFCAALVRAGVPIAGYVHDLSSGRRWWGARGSGAWRDGQPARVRRGSTLLVPTPQTGHTAVVPAGFRRLRVTGCTGLDQCLVADGSADAWHDLDRGGTHVHDVAAGLAVLLAAGGVALAPDGSPLRLAPDTETLIRFAAASDEAVARELCALFAV